MPDEEGRGQQMKIALVIKHYALHQGGAERYAVDLSRALVKEGHQVHVLANRYEPDGPATVRFHPVSMRQKPAWLKVLSFSRSARKIIEREDFDVVYALTQMYPQDMYLTGGGVYRHWMRVRYPFRPFRWLAYLSRPIHLANLYLESRLYAPKNNRIVVANSLLCKGHVEEYWGVPSQRIRVVYHGVDHDIFNPGNAATHRSQARRELGIDSRAPVALFVSNNWKRKGLATILRALASLKPRTAFNLVVVGRGKPQKYGNLVQKLGLSDRVRFMGHTDDILKYFGAADLVVLPTLYDSFGNVCIEAMACGVPVIASSSSGVAELIRDGENGYVLHKADDAAELARLLSDCADPVRLKEMGNAARETSLGFTPLRNVLETIEVCREVLSQKGGDAGKERARLPAGAIPRQQDRDEQARISFGGIRWMYTAKDLSPASLSSADSLTGRVIKSTSKRLVICSSEGLFAKEIRYNGARSLLKSLAGGTACKEARIILELARRGIDVPRVAAFGMQRRHGLLCRDLLLTRRVDGALPLQELVPQLSKTAAFAERARFIEDLADFTRRLHEKGVQHTDLHVGNILAAEGDRTRFYLLDADRVRLGAGPLSEREANENLALLLCTFWSLSGAKDRLRFFKHYTGVARMKGQAARIREIQRAALAISRRSWQKKTLRCLHTNSRFVRSEWGAFTVFRSRRAEVERALNALLPDPDKALRRGELLKDGRTVKAAKVEIEGRSYFLKRYNCKGNLYRLRNAFRRSRAVRTWFASWGLTVRGVPVPAPLICIEERHFRLLEKSYLLYEYVDGSRLCDAWPSLDGFDKRRLLQKIAITLGTMHRLGGYHGDLKWPNFLVRKVQNRFHVTLSDLDGAKVGAKLPAAKARKDVERFLTDLEQSGDSVALAAPFLETWHRWATGVARRPPT